MADPRELDVARELACDEGVVELSAARQAYARTLRDVAGFSSGLSHAAPADSMSLAGGRSLMLRVTRTLALAKRKPARAAVIAAALVSLAGAPIAVAQVMLATPAPYPPPPPAPPALPTEFGELAQPPAPPEAPAAAEISADGKVRATFAATVVSIAGSKADGYSIKLRGGNIAATCLAQFDGMGGLNVKAGDVVAEGGIVGSWDAGRKMRLDVRCTGGLNGGSQHSLMAAPPEPPAPPVEMAAAPLPPPMPAPPAPMAPLAPIAPLSPQGINYRLNDAPHAVINESARTTSGFGNRADPFGGETKFHAGVDLAAPRGVEIHAPGNARVARAENATGYGNVVELKTPENYVLRLGQMDEIKVKRGDSIKAGVVVGTMWSGGLSTGPHLHIEVLVNGAPVDPTQVQGLKLTAG